MFATAPAPPERLLVFARVPEKGAVKSRLAATIGPDRALAVYEAMLADTLRSAGARREGRLCEVLWTAEEVPGTGVLQQAFGDLPLAMQTGIDLGQRLSMAFSERFFFHRTVKLIAIGVDDPLLPAALIDEAFALLDACDFVVGPAHDGGYYLIGCRAPAFRTELFEDVAWGTNTVLSATVQRIRGWQRTLAMLPLRGDIDREEDLERFRQTAEEGSLLELLNSWSSK